MTVFFGMRFIFSIIIFLSHYSLFVSRMHLDLNFNFVDNLDLRKKWSDFDFEVADIEFIYQISVDLSISIIFLSVSDLSRSVLFYDEPHNNLSPITPILSSAWPTFSPTEYELGIIKFNYINEQKKCSKR